jgi:hypothetical protein
MRVDWIYEAQHDDIVGCGEHGKEPSGSIHFWKFLD